MLSQTACQQILEVENSSEKTKILSDALKYTFSVNFSISKAFQAVKTIFRGNEMCQVAKFDIVQKVLFRTLYSSKNLALKTGQIAAEQNI